MRSTHFCPVVSNENICKTNFAYENKTHHVRSWPFPTRMESAHNKSNSALTTDNINIFSFHFLPAHKIKLTIFNKENKTIEFAHCYF